MTREERNTRTFLHNIIEDTLYRNMSEHLIDLLEEDLIKTINNTSLPEHIKKELRYEISDYMLNKKFLQRNINRLLRSN